MSTGVVVERATLDDDLAALARVVRAAEWGLGGDNEMADYDETALRRYVDRDDALLLTARVDGRLAGLALAAVIVKPYADSDWLYVDEVDTHPDHRRRGVGRALMQWLFAYADEHDLDEVWLGTEVDNEPANALYRSLDPTEVEQFVGYTFRLDDEK